MGKYADVQDAVFNLFATLQWEARSISTFPSGFDGEKGDPPYIRVSTISSDTTINSVRAGGMMMVEIFTAWGNGPANATEIADALDEFFEKKTLDGVQFQQSTLSQLERDRDNPGLGRNIYSIPYTLFGV